MRMAMRWYALHSKPNHENLLWEQLTLREIEAFLPCVNAKTVNPRARKTRPIFPGYVFVHFDFSLHGESGLQWIPGASGLVKFGNDFGYIPDNLIHGIRRRVEEMQAGVGEPLPTARPGDKVIIQDGPFKGYEAVFDGRLSGSERVRVLLRLFQREAIPLHLSARQILVPKYGA
ncbi:MAG: transcription termination/antitermination NusG family protein [Anaerolineales bacterium]